MLTPTLQDIIDAIEEANTLGVDERVVRNAQRAVYKLFDQSPTETTPQEMRLCEYEHVFLKPNQLYIFTVDENCARCVELERIAKGE